MAVLIVFQLFLGVVTASGFYAVSYGEFHRLCAALDADLVYLSLPVAEIAEMEVKGINEENFKNEVAAFMKRNINHSKVKVSYYFYNEDGENSQPNQRRFVQMKVENLSRVFKFEKEFNYELIVDLPASS